MKKISCTILAALMCFAAFAFFGCQTARTRTESELLIGYQDGGYGEVHFRNWEKKYNEKYPDEPIKLLLDGDGSYLNSVGNLLESDEAPDVMVSTMNWIIHAAKGLLESLDDVYTKPFNSSKSIGEAINPILSEAITYNGAKYVMPFDENITGLVINRGMFDEKGWTVPTTMEEMAQTIQQIASDPINSDPNTRKHIAPFSWSGTISYYWTYLLNSWWASYSGIDSFNAFLKMDKASVFHQPGRQKALEAMISMIGGVAGTPKNSVNGALGLSHTESQRLFFEGRAAMIPNAAWLEAESVEIIPDGFKMEMIAPPVISGGSGQKIIYSHMDNYIVIPKRAQNKELAKKFIEFISTEEGCLELTKAVGGFRPFEVDYSAIQTDSPFLRSTLKLKTDNTTIYEVSASPIYRLRLTNAWPHVSVAQMVKENQTGERAYNLINEYVDSNFGSWKTQAGVN